MIVGNPSSRVLLLFCAALFLGALCCAQDLSPRAYVITPVNFNSVTFTYSFNDGNVLFDQALPVTGGEGKINSRVCTSSIPATSSAARSTSPHRCLTPRAP